MAIEPRLLAKQLAKDGYACVHVPAADTDIVLLWREVTLPMEWAGLPVVTRQEVATLKAWGATPPDAAAVIHLKQLFPGCTVQKC